MYKKALVGIAIVLIVGAGYVLFGRTPGPEAKVVVNDSGFEPKEITVQKGTVVAFQNLGQTGHWPASNLHPTHGVYPEFDPQKDILPGESWRFKFDKVGTWAFHDHEFPEFRGTITVE